MGLSLGEWRGGVLCFHGLDEGVAGTDAVSGLTTGDGDEVRGFHAHPGVGVVGGHHPAEAIELQGVVGAVVVFGVERPS